MTLEEQSALLELEQAVEKVRRAVDDATFDHAESTGCAQWIPDRQFKNLSLTGKPTLVSCPFHEWKKVVSERACEKFITNK